MLEDDTVRAAENQECQNMTLTAFAGRSVFAAPRTGDDD
jgi:hypothetical protein